MATRRRSTSRASSRSSTGTTRRTTRRRTTARGTSRSRSTTTRRRRKGTATSFGSAAGLLLVWVLLKAPWWVKILALAVALLAFVVYVVVTRRGADDGTDDATDDATDDRRETATTQTPQTDAPPSEGNAT